MTPMYIDGILYVAIALFTFLQTQFGGDEASKYITPVNLFWLKLVVGGLAASALALKLYRSTAFSDNKAAVATQKAIDSGTVPSTVVTVTPAAPLAPPVVAVTETQVKPVTKG